MVCDRCDPWPGGCLMRRQRHRWLPRSVRTGRIFPNSITRVVPASGWPSDWLTLTNQRRKTVWLSGIGERYVQLLSVAHGGRSSVTNVAGEALWYVHLLSVAAYGGHGRVMRSDKAAFSVTLGTIFLNLCVKRYRDNEHDETNTDMFQVE